MSKDTSEPRDSFLIERYNVLWANIDRSMRGIWNVLATITLTGTVLAATHKGYVPYSLGIILVLLLIFWGINITLELNGWHRRNLFFLTAVEREFLLDSDWGKMLPRSYREPDKRLITFYRLNLALFILLGVVLASYAAVRECFGPKPDEVWAVWGVPTHWAGICAGSLATLCHYFRDRSNAMKQWHELFGDIDASGPRTEPPEGE